MGEELFPDIKAIVPGLRTSVGNETLMALVEDFFKDVFTSNITIVRLKPDIRCGLSSIAWQLVEMGKGGLAGTNTGDLISSREMHERITFKDALLSLVGRIIASFPEDQISSFSDLLRGNTIFNLILLQPYQRYVRELQTGAVIVSTNLQAFMVLYPPDTRLLYPVIDLCPEAKVPRAPALLRNGKVIVLSPCTRSTQGLIKQGIPRENVIQTGVLVSKTLYHAIEERVKPYNKSQKALVHIGGSGPEILQALKVISKLAESGIHVTVFCGEQKDLNVRFRDSVHQLINRYPHLIETIGGVKNDPASTRDGQLKTLLEHLADPSFTIVVARPSQWILIGPALGFSMIVLDPYQRFEKEAYNEVVNGNVPNTLLAEHILSVSSAEISKLLQFNHEAFESCQIIAQDPSILRNIILDIV